MRQIAPENIQNSKNLLIRGREADAAAGEGSLRHPSSNMVVCSGTVNPRNRWHLSSTTCLQDRSSKVSMAGDAEQPIIVSSSRPPSFSAEQEALFREVIELLEQSGIGFAVSGAFALQQHTGICRNTKDL